MKLERRAGDEARKADILSGEHNSSALIFLGALVYHAVGSKKTQ